MLYPKRIVLFLHLEEHSERRFDGSKVLVAVLYQTVSYSSSLIQALVHASVDAHNLYTRDHHQVLVKDFCSHQEQELVSSSFSILIRSFNPEWPLSILTF